MDLLLVICVFLTRVVRGQHRYRSAHGDWVMVVLQGMEDDS